MFFLQNCFRINQIYFYTTLFLSNWIRIPSSFIPNLSIWSDSHLSLYLRCLIHSRESTLVFELYILWTTPSYSFSEISKIIFCNTVVQSIVEKILKIDFYVYFHLLILIFEVHKIKVLFLWRHRDIHDCFTYCS